MNFTCLTDKSLLLLKFICTESQMIVPKSNNVYGVECSASSFLFFRIKTKSVSMSKSSFSKNIFSSSKKAVTSPFFDCVLRKMGITSRKIIYYQLIVYILMNSLSRKYKNHFVLSYIHKEITTKVRY